MTETDAAPLSLPAVRALYEAYGADPARWPEDRRAGALAFMTAHPGEAARLAAEARAIDALLAALPPDPGPSADLVARILAEAPRPAVRPAGLAARLRSMFVVFANLKTAAAAASLAAGLGFGYAAGAAAVDAAAAGALLSVGEVDLAAWDVVGDGESG